MLRMAMALAVALALGVQAMPARAEILRVTLDGLGYFDVDSSVTPVQDAILNNFYGYNVVDLSITANGVDFTESNILAPDFQVYASVLLTAGAVPELFLSLRNGSSFLGVGDLTCSVIFNVSSCIYSPVIFLAQGTDITSFTQANSVAPIPEPATFALLGAGLLGLVGARRRRLP